MTEPDRHEWPAADWASLSAEQQRGWRAASPGDRLRWLEQALDFALAAGALDRDRARRADTARRWATAVDD